MDWYAELKLDNARARRSSLQSNMLRLDDEIERFEKEVAKYAEGAECTLFGLKLDSNHYEPILAALKSQLEENRREVAAIEAEYPVLKNDEEEAA